MYKFIDGGVCAPIGFKAAGIECGIRKGKSKKDLALIVTETKTADAAAIYTTNAVKGAPITISKQHLSNGKAHAVICNSGIANTCTADGADKAELMCRIAGEALGVPAEDIVPASTGVIGHSLDITPIKTHIAQLVSELSYCGSGNAAEAIMTTDTVKKEFAVEMIIQNKAVRIGGIAKGSGMINPNMATMLSFLTTDADIESHVLQGMLQDAADKSFNCVSVDGDTSTNDTLLIMANGKSGVTINIGTEEYKQFVEGLTAVCVFLARMLAKDGEGASKLIICNVDGGKDEASVKRIAKSVINSPLVKTAIFGCDANWGRIICAVGYSGIEVDVSLIDISFESEVGAIIVCQKGAGLDFNEDTALEILKQDEITININLNQGNTRTTAWGCDLSYDYVKINGDYRS